MSIDWNGQLVDQLDWHWQHHLRPRLDGLTDEEYFWEPVPGSWSVRRRADTTASIAHGSGEHGSGEYAIEYSWPEPTPPPVTTIAWRLAHLIVGVLGQRNAAHFDGPPCDYDSFGYAGTVDEAVRQLDEAYARWAKSVRGLGDDGLAKPCGPAEGPYAESPIATLVLHINREMIHHGAEICLLRDLYRNRG
jgi:hypothetical protein